MLVVCPVDILTVIDDLLRIRQVDGNTVRHCQHIAIHPADGERDVVFLAILHRIRHLPAARVQLQ